MHVLQDNPDQGVLVLIKGLVNVIKVYKFDTEETRHKVYLNALVTLSAMSQDKYLYRVEKGNGLTGMVNRTETLTFLLIG